MRRHLLAFSILSLVAVAMTGCIGFFVGPGMSCQSKDMFASVPYVAKRPDGHVLCWSQGSYPFYFSPRYRIRDGALWFSVQATTSTGDAKWKLYEMRIDDERAIAALERGGAFWWEPDGTGIRLEIIEDEPKKKEPNQPLQPTPGIRSFLNLISPARRG